MNTEDGTEVAQHSRILNYCRIMQVLSNSTKHFQRIFKKRWLKYQKLKKNAQTEWNDSAENRFQLIEICPTATPRMKESFKNESLDLWDVTLLTHIITTVSTEIRNMGGKTNKKEDGVIDGIRIIRNKLSHAKPVLSDEEFQKQFNQLSKFMIKLGDTQSAMDELKNSLMKIGVSKVEPQNFFARDNIDFEITGLDEEYKDLSELLENSSTFPGKKTKLHILKFHEMPNIREHKSEQTLESSHIFEKENHSRCDVNKKHRLLSFFSFFKK